MASPPQRATRLAARRATEAEKRKRAIVKLRAAARAAAIRRLKSGNYLFEFDGYKGSAIQVPINAPRRSLKTYAFNGRRQAAMNRYRNAARKLSTVGGNSSMNAVRSMPHLVAFNPQFATVLTKWPSTREPFKQLYSGAMREFRATMESALGSVLAPDLQIIVEYVTMNMGYRPAYVGYNYSKYTKHMRPMNIENPEEFKYVQRILFEKMDEHSHPQLNEHEFREDLVFGIMDDDGRMPIAKAVAITATVIHKGKPSALRPRIRPFRVTWMLYTEGSVYDTHSSERYWFVRGPAELVALTAGEKPDIAKTAAGMSGADDAFFDESRFPWVLEKTGVVRLREEVARPAVKTIEHHALKWLYAPHGPAAKAAISRLKGR